MIRINLLAPERPTAKKAAAAPGSFQAYLLLMLFGGGAAVACVLGWLFMQAKIATLDGEIAAAQKRQQELQAIQKQVEDLERKRKTFQDKVDLIERLKAQQGAPVRMLDEISKALPDFVWLTSLNQAGANVTLEGESATLTAIADFMANLQDAGEGCGKPKAEERHKCWFPNVELKQSQQRQNVVQFTLTAAFQTPRDKPEPPPAPAAPAAGRPGARPAARGGR